jgi:hypothetical protein
MDWKACASWLNRPVEAHTALAELFNHKTTDLKLPLFIQTRLKIPQGILYLKKVNFNKQRIWLLVVT